MSTSNSGMNYAPKGKPSPVCAAGEFIFAAAFLDHGHIYGQCNGLREAGGELRWVYDPDAARVKQFVDPYPEVKVARSFDEILGDASVKLVASAAVPCDRGPIGVRVMRAGKDYFTDKGPFTSLDQLETARAVARETKQKYACYYSERLHVECAMFATELIAQGALTSEQARSHPVGGPRQQLCQKVHRNIEPQSE
jgi:predicted dehydrogenase